MRPTPSSRRQFMTASGAAAAGVYMARNAGGSPAAEMLAREAADKLVGVSKWDLDTPALGRGDKSGQGTAAGWIMRRPRCGRVRR